MRRIARDSAEIAFVAVLFPLWPLLRLWTLVAPSAYPPQLTALLEGPMRRRFQDADRCVTASGLRPGQRVLEIGPGGGYVTEAILRRIGTGPLTCLDLQPAMLKQVRTRFAERAPALACGSGSVLPFRDQSFDVVLLVGVLGEIPDEDEALRECRRVLAPGGTLAVSECLPDPDYVVASALRQKARAAGFAVGERTDGVLGYTQRLERA